MPASAWGAQCIPMSSDTASQWPSRLDGFAALTSEPTPSEYLRTRGVYPNVIDLAGDTTDLAVLDAGCGPGWVHQAIRCADAHQCDIDTPPELPGVTSTCCRLEALTYPDEMFDLVVSSLVLCYIGDLEPVLAELYRVTKPGGRLVVAVPHPYFYRTGTVTDEGDVIIDRSLASTWRIDDLYIGDTLGPFTYFGHRTDHYLNTTIQAGWELLETREWFCDTDDFHARWPQERRRAGHTPFYWFCHFQRPESR